MRRKKRVREICESDLDGRRAYLPHPIFQNCLFSATRQRQAGEYRRREVVVQNVNRFGDITTIRSARSLFARPDMGVFLAVVALIQRAGFHRLVDEMDGTPAGMFISHFAMPDLYDLTRMGGNRAREAVMTSLETVGSARISIHYAHPETHGGNASFTSGSFWNLKITPRRGRGGSLVTICPAECLIPRDTHLFADAVVANSLRSDTARGIFWALLCREHMRGTAQEWQDLIGAGTERIDKWRARQLMPAVEELSLYGYYIAEGGDQILIRRPTGVLVRPGKKCLNTP